jgi:hypothetical protein
VVETGRPEAVLQRRIESLVFAEEDPGDHRLPLASHARSKAAGDEGAQRVGDTSKSAPSTDDSEAVGREDDMYALPTQV